jgi:hypothetical protein
MMKQIPKIVSGGARFNFDEKNDLNYFVRTITPQGEQRIYWGKDLPLAAEFLPLPVSFIPGRANASPSNTQGGSPVREIRPPGSVRGVFSNWHSYRDSVNPPRKQRMSFRQRSVTYVKSFLRAFTRQKRYPTCFKFRLGL